MNCEGIAGVVYLQYFYHGKLFANLYFILRMLYYLFNYLDQVFDFPGAGMFQYISFRATVAFLLALLCSTLIGKRIIQLLQKLQIGEIVRDLNLEGQMQKKGTPTMGGVIILSSILIPCTFQFRKHKRSRFDPWEVGMAVHSSILAWRIPRTEEPGKLQSMRSQRLGHD